MAILCSLLLICLATAEGRLSSENSQSESDEQLLPNDQEVHFEICFEAFSNTSLEKLKRTLKNARSNGRVNLTLYNIYVINSEMRSEQTELRKKRPKVLKTWMEAWQVVAIIGFLALVIMVIIIYRLYMQNSKLKRKAMLTNTIANNTGPLSYNHPSVRPKSFSIVDQETHQGFT